MPVGAAPLQPQNGRERQNQAKTAAVLARAIGAKLPAGWKAVLENRRDYPFIYLQVNRLKPLQMERVVLPGSSIEDAARPPALTDFALEFRVEPFISWRRFGERRAENQKIAAAVHQQIAVKYGSKLSKSTVSEEGHRLYAARYELPDYFFRDISLSWLGDVSVDSPEAEIERVIDPKSRRECVAVARQVLAMLSNYPK